MRRFSNFRSNREVIAIVKKTLENKPDTRQLDNDCIEEIVKTLERSAHGR